MKRILRNHCSIRFRPNPKLAIVIIVSFNEVKVNERAHRHCRTVLLFGFVLGQFCFDRIMVCCRFVAKHTMIIQSHSYPVSRERFHSIRKMREISMKMRLHENHRKPRHLNRTGSHQQSKPTVVCSRNLSRELQQFFRTALRSFWLHNYGLVFLNVII